MGRMNGKCQDIKLRTALMKSNFTSLGSSQILASPPFVRARKISLTSSGCKVALISDVNSYYWIWERCKIAKEGRVTKNFPNIQSILSSVWTFHSMLKWHTLRIVVPMTLSSHRPNIFSKCYVAHPSTFCCNIQGKNISYSQ